MAIRRNLALCLTGGVLYYLAETLGRGHSHWTMFVLGGLCFVLVGALNEVLPWELPLPLQMLAGAAIITALEFATGCIVNLWLGWDVWDYSHLRGNLLGQISPEFSVLWFLLSGLIIFLDDFLRWRWYGEEWPRYRLW